MASLAQDMKSLRETVKNLEGYRSSRDKDLERLVTADFVSILKGARYCPHSVECRILVDSAGQPCAEWDGVVFGTNPYTNQLCLFLIESKMSFNLDKLKSFNARLSRTKSILDRMFSMNAPTLKGCDQFYQMQAIYYGLYKNNCTIQGIVASNCFDPIFEAVLIKRNIPYIKLSEGYQLYNYNLDA